MRIKAFVICLCLLWTTPSKAAPEGWRGIVPLHSTCDDVKRILEVDRCELPTSQYDLPDFRVTINFTTSACCENWQVPSGTVAEIIISPKKPTPLSEYNLTEGYRKVVDEEIVGQEWYDNRVEGVTVYVFNGMITHFMFYPSVKDEKLHCYIKKEYTLKRNRAICRAHQDSDSNYRISRFSYDFEPILSRYLGVLCI